MKWHTIHESLSITKQRELFDSDLFVQGQGKDDIESPMVHINVNKN